MSKSERSTFYQKKNNDKIEQYIEEKEEKDDFCIMEVISRGKGDNTVSFGHQPFKNNSVLTVEHTNKSLYVLLENGTLFSYGANVGVFDQKLQMKTGTMLPIQVRMPTKVVNVVCGRDHCLARGSNYKVYCWGANAYGQLGLKGFPMNPKSEKEEPTEISEFSARKGEDNMKTVKIVQIYAGQATSFAISEDKTIYGWGSNNKGQLGVDPHSTRRIQSPVVIEINEDFHSDISLKYNYFQDTMYVCECKIE